MIAARTATSTPAGKEARKALLAQASAHRARAAALDPLATTGGFAPVAQDPTYPLPADAQDPAALQALPRSLAEGLTVEWVTMIGAAPFEARELCITAALTEAARTAALGGSLPALPSLERPASAAG